MFIIYNIENIILNIDTKTEKSFIKNNLKFNFSKIDLKEISNQFQQNILKVKA